MKRLGSAFFKLIMSFMSLRQGLGEAAEKAGMVAVLFFPPVSYITGQAIAIGGTAAAA